MKKKAIILSIIFTGIVGYTTFSIVLNDNNLKPYIILICILVGLICLTSGYLVYNSFLSYFKLKHKVKK
jgi:MFS-type transporter involved in bile tolerance (Atg22 family)